ncbi:DUF4386 domain-containing protein [Teredinibacter sp. KSP-S5-2]|uniref:DUF4386 domain-containing protein n=1 Tax=Teredinibacter sp. KSP-S5-2 TaxID=3034506 RepID=UPI0029347428|nr:DUF4386 domain-containing protein [Teredinibacter sp. KSP-S5-2]WNO10635.1 DUF4386 domain-containing protein [Teredinibacter sp. KSP-S5-2]
MSRIQLARWSGVVYLLLIITGIFGIVYVPTVIIDWSDPAVTASNVQTKEFLFRMGIFSELICFILFIVLPLMLYKLLHTVNRDAAILMVVFSLISIPSTLSNVVKHIDIIFLLEEHAYLQVIPLEQLHAKIMYLFGSYNNATLVSNIFWGAWLIPFGFLVYKSNFLPKLIGVFLVLGGVGYFLEFALKFIFTIDQVPWYVTLPSSIGEFGVCLWLLIFGVKKEVIA